MRRLIFPVLAALSLVVFISEAKAGCGLDKKNNEIEPVAVADSTGVLFTTMPTGQTIRIGGFWPGDKLCRNLLFQRAHRLCPSGEAKVDAPRPSKDCAPGSMRGDSCLHFVCVPKAR